MLCTALHVPVVLCLLSSGHAVNRTACTGGTVSPVEWSCCVPVVLRVFIGCSSCGENSSQPAAIVPIADGRGGARGARNIDLEILWMDTREILPDRAAWRMSGSVARVQIFTQHKTCATF